MPAAIIGQVALLMCMALGIGAAIARWAWERWVRSQ